MNTQQKEFIRFIKLLNDNDVLKDVIVIGSWAEFLYKECRLLPGFEANIKTLDIDFLLKNLRRPNPPKNVATLAKESGYIVQQDIMDGTTKILDKEGLERFRVKNGKTPKSGYTVEHLKERTDMQDRIADLESALSNSREEVKRLAAENRELQQALDRMMEINRDLQRALDEQREKEQGRTASRWRDREQESGRSKKSRWED